MPSLRYIVKTIGKYGEKRLASIRELAAALYERIPPQGRLPALICLCLGMALVLGMLIRVLVEVQTRSGLSARDAAAAFEPHTIPPEDFFLPGEPDFLPEILFEREPREKWTAGDARPFWTDPLDYGPEIWIEGIQAAVDELLERVP